jgi:hypothetical protein
MAFVQGYDAALCHAALAGFREWLIVRHGGGNNLAWTAHVEAEIEAGLERSHETDIERFFDLLEEFWRDRHARDGLAVIHARYTTWLRRQLWYRGEVSFARSYRTFALSRRGGRGTSGR